MTILCLIGPSGSGKTTLAAAMAEGAQAPTDATHNPDLSHIPTICSYTTRPMRPGERNGREHIFIDDREAARLLTTRQPLAYTYFGGYHYFALWEQLQLGIVGYDTITYVIDEAGYIALQAAIIDYEEHMKAKHLPHHPIHTLPILIERDAQTIAQTIDPARVARDKDRSYLDLVYPAIIIHNDAHDAQALITWSQQLRHALHLYLIYHQFFRPAAQEVHLHTAMGVAEIIAALNGAI